MERRVIVILGPTCSGKTEVGIALALNLKTEIISADSRQIYKYLNIGTAKPSPEELKRVKHYFIDYLEPDEYFNVSRFEHECLEVINVLHSRSKIPVIVGGSGLYVKAIVDGIVDVADADPEYRKELLNIKRNKGNSYLHDMLKKIDPKSASAMLPQNWKRVIRALEVYRMCGEPIWKIHEEYKRETDIDFIQIGLNWDRETLYKNIEQRIDEMISHGLEAEVKSILDKGYNSDLNALNTVGYKEMISYLNNEITIERAIELIKRNTRRFAKRQFTWFRKDKRINWIDVNSRNDLNNIPIRISNDFLNY